jgi:hypothetical protein
MKMNKEQLADKVARELGYVDYPSDSVEQGNFWYVDAVKAPFGVTIAKELFEKELFDGRYTLILIEGFSIEFKWLTDATLEVYSIILENVITTTNGYLIGIIECIADDAYIEEKE